MNYGFFRVAAAAPRLRVGDPDYNAGQLGGSDRPGCGAAGTPAGDPGAVRHRLHLRPDLFFTAALQQAADRAVQRLAAYTAGKDIAVLIGAPVPYKNSLYNCALLLRDGQVQGMVPKVHLADY